MRLGFDIQDTLYFGVDNMKKRKVFIRILAITLVLLQLVMAAACAKDNTNVGENSGSSDTQIDSAHIESIVDIVKDGKSEYTIVYSKAMAHYGYIAQRIASVIYEKYKVMITLSDEEVEGKQILVGPFTKNDDYNNVKDQMKKSREFAVVVSGETLVLYAANQQYGVELIFKFMEFMETSGSAALSISSEDNYIYSKTDDELMSVNSLEYVTMYQQMYKTYGTRAEEELQEAKYGTARKDQKLVEALKERIGEAMAVYVGDTRVIYNGFYHKLDTEDYTNAAKKNGNNILIPAEFAKKYFGNGISIDADGFFDLSAYCASSSEYGLYTNDKLCMVYPKGVEGFDDQDKKIGGYTNKQYIERLVEFFTDEFLPEPIVNVEDTRVIIAESPYPENVADHSMQQYVTTYSPAIAVNVVNGQKIMYAAYEYSTILENVESKADTALSISTDDGKTWTEIAKVDDMRWASLFILNDEVYLMGNSVANGQAKIARLKSNNTFETANIGSGSVIGGGAPGAVVVHNGRIYRMYSAVVSADINSDLMNASSWKITNKASDVMNKEWFSEVTHNPKNTDASAVGEANVVVGPDGHVYVIGRMFTSKLMGYGGILRVSDDNERLELVDGILDAKCPEKSLVWMDSTATKFSVRYDEESELYYAIVSTYTVNGEYHQRTVLSLLYSSDLINWTTATSLLVDRELLNECYAARMHGFQYADFVIDGDDIIMVVREATGYTNWFHDGKWTTFYRIEDFRDLAKKVA